MAESPGIHVRQYREGNLGYRHQCTHRRNGKTFCRVLTRLLIFPAFRIVSLQNYSVLVVNESTAKLIDILENFRREVEPNSISPDRLGYILLLMLKEMVGPEAFDSRFLRKDIEDQAHELITFLSGLNIGDYIPEALGAAINKEGDAELKDILVRGEAVFKESLSSPDFITGFLTGKGWALTKDKFINALGIAEDKYTLEIDNLIVRGILRVYEMVVSQLLGENDNRIFTAMLEVDHYDPETGRIWLDTMDGKFYNPFRKDDYIMVQQFNGMPSEENDYYVTKRYELIITNVGIGNLADGENRLDWVEFKNFTSQMEDATPENLIKKGDTLVRVDNASDPERKGFVQIISVGPKTPYMDVVYGLKTDPDDYLKVRLGNLQGIRHHLFGWLEGWGLYANNAYLVGDFRMNQSGDSVRTQVEMLKEQFSSQYSEIDYKVPEEENILVNASFSENMKGWTRKADIVKILKAPIEGILNTEKEVLINGNLFCADSQRATVADYNGQRMLFISNSGIRQTNSTIDSKNDFKNNPLTHIIYKEGETSGATGLLTYEKETVKDRLYLVVRFLPLTSGNLTIGFRGAETDIDSLPNPETLYVEASREWQYWEWIGTWDMKGDFVLEYTGDMWVQALSLTQDPLSDFKEEMGTQIIQTSSNIKLLGWNIDKHSGDITELGLDLDAANGRIDIWAKETKGNSESIAEIIIEAGKIEQRVSNNEGNISSITQTVNSITSRVSDAEGNISTINQTVNSISSRVSNAEGNISSITQTVNSISSRVSDAEGNISSITQTVSSINSTVTAQGNQISSISQNVSNLTSSLNLKVGYNDVIASINMSAEKNNGSLITINADKISLKGYTEINNFIIDTAGNVTVNGDLTASFFANKINTAINGTINGSIITNQSPSGTAVLPTLKSGMAILVRVMLPWLRRSNPSGSSLDDLYMPPTYDLHLLTGQNARFLLPTRVTTNVSNTYLHLPRYGGCYLDLIGVSGALDGGDVWYVIPHAADSGNFRINNTSTV